MELLGRNLATITVLQIVGYEVKAMYYESLERVKNDDFKLLDILHHLSSGIKAFSTEKCYSGCDEMRQACGGAGFLLSSGVADWWGDLAPYPTFEGVNTVMFQQSARLLFKSMKKVSKGKEPIELF